jgi:hypothetical protein
MLLENKRRRIGDWEGMGSNSSDVESSPIIVEPNSDA